MRFEKKADCYLDTETGLEWSLENYGPFDWEHVIAYTNGMGNGWRVPSIHELISIIDFFRSNPATELPDMKLDYYWSSNVLEYDLGYIWSIYFVNGNMSYCFYQTYYKYVRYVRGGPLEYKV